MTLSVRATPAPTATATAPPVAVAPMTRMPPFSGSMPFSSSFSTLDRSATLPLDKESARTLTLPAAFWMSPRLEASTLLRSMATAAVTPTPTAPPLTVAPNRSAVTGCSAATVMLFAFSTTAVSVIRAITASWGSSV